MLQRVDDCKGRWVCSADPETGLVELKYKQVAASCIIPIGEEYKIKIQRDDTVTVLRRVSSDEIRSESYIMTA